MTLRAVFATQILITCLCAAPAPTLGQTFDVPDGFVVENLSADAGDGDIRPILRIQPASGSFAELSALALAEIVQPVGNPDSWLKSRVAVDAGSEDDFREFLDSPDSPFGSPVFDPLRSVLPRLFEGLNSLGRTPLAFCESPEDTPVAIGTARELSCSFDAGPFQRFLVYRLHDIEGRQYYVRIDSMNERRLRHLLAIANSFSVAR